MLESHLKLALKILLRRKFFTFISLVGISLTLVVLMTVAAIFDNSFGPMPPESNLDRTVVVQRAHLSGENMDQTSNPGWLLLDRYLRDLPGAEAYSFHSEPEGVASYVNGERVDSYLKRADATFWKIHDFRFLEGGPFTETDVTNAVPVAVINAATRGRFFGDEPALGRAIEADAVRYRVVGVVSNVPRLRHDVFADLFVPVTVAKTDEWKDELLGRFFGTYLAKDAQGLAAIRKAIAERSALVPVPKGFKTFDTSSETRFEAISREIMGGQVKSPATKVKAAFGLVALLFMLLPAVNLINLNVSRILERAPEIGVRKAFGASSRSLILQFVTENVVLCLVGGVLGFGLSLLALRLVAESGVIPYAEFHLSYRVFGWSLLMTLAFGLLSGVYPAWRMSRLDPIQALRGGSR